MGRGATGNPLTLVYARSQALVGACMLSLIVSHRDVGERRALAPICSRSLILPTARMVQRARQVTLCRRRFDHLLLRDLPDMPAGIDEAGGSYPPRPIDRAVQ